ncbi:hypothetical protein SAMN04489752_2965 [Brevibacterium siliguriense]|uniref:DUF4878 domain-containing protein n=1 Tax=Brevibacterium siliguriense TaxID=1136497 RepID=A0A1H1WF53_9MICO|nr:hypothetical protein [Brevibacterium siliguriense]SDS96028.1 hypothetical protein SAMN04489752_2965 [Brevibacterium siliguriense]
MSNGNDHPNFPPPPSEPPENGGPKPESEPPANEDFPDSSAAAGDETPTSQPHSANGTDSTDGPSESDAQTPTENGSFASGDGSSEPDAPAQSDDGSSVPDDQAPPLGAPASDAPARPTVAPAAPQQNQPPQYSGPSAQNDQSFGPGQNGGSNAPGGPQPVPYPGTPSPSDQPQNGQYPNNQYQNPQQPNGGYPGAQPQGGPRSSGQYSNSAYPGAQNQPPYPGAQNQPPYPGAQNKPGQFDSAQNHSGQYQTGSGPNAQQTGSGPSQAIPQPAPAPGFAGSQTNATRAENRPEKKKGKLPLFITLGAVALVIILVLVGFFVVSSVNKNKYGPDKVAEDYVEALNKGDFAAAEKIAPSARPEGTNLDLLQKEFTDSSSAKIEKAKVESSKVDGDKGTVVVSYELDGSPYNVELSATKDGKQDLFFDKWTMKGPDLNVISIDVPAADGLSVNGKDYKAKSGTTSFAVYPGSYDFTIPKSKWISEASDTAKVNFPKAFAPGGQANKGQVSPTTLNLELSPTGAFDKEVQKQVEKELKKCFDNKSIEPKCDFIKYDPTEIPVGGSDKKLDDLAKKNTAKWDMKEMPKVKASFGAGDTSTGSFFTEKPGKFNFSVDGKRAGSSYFSNGNSLSVSGSVKIDGDKLSVEFFDF